MRKGGRKLLGKNKVLFDTGPLFLYFAGDENVKEIFDDVAAGKVMGYTCEVNMAEFYYKTCENFGREVAEVRNTSIRRSKIAVLAVDERLTRIAGRIKCTYKGMLSLADAYTLAAAKMHDATLITTDSQLADLKLVPARLLRIS
ncbi:MAG: type II toxin-antitoxin system VapC family toxin [Candidatus Bathyarchaeia archaeon]